MAIDIVYVSTVGLVVWQALNQEEPLPSPAASAGVEGHVDVTAESDRADILAGLMKFTGGAPAWVTFTDLVRTAPRGEWWLYRVADAQREFIELKAVTDATVEEYLTFLEGMIRVDLDATGDGTMQGFHVYLKATYVGAAGFWPDNTEADFYFGVWFADWEWGT